MPIKNKIKQWFSQVASTGKTKTVHCNFRHWTVADNGTTMVCHLKQCSKCPLQVKKQYISELLPTTVTTVADVHASCDDPTTASATTDVTSTPNAEAAMPVNLPTMSS